MATVTLKDGEQRELHFRNRALLQLEKQHGGLPAYIDSMRDAYLTSVARAFAAAFGISEAEAAEMVDGKRMPEYFEAITAELTERLGLGDA